MNSNKFIIKRKGIIAIYYGLLISFCSILLAINSFMENVSGSWLISIYLCGLMILVSLYSIIEFTIKFDSTELKFNKVATIPYQEIKKVYVGEFTFIESFEENDKLPLEKYKREELKYLIGNHKPLLSIHTPNQMYFVPANYFTQKNLDKVFALLKEKGIALEIQSKYEKEVKM